MLIKLEWAFIAHIVRRESITVEKYLALCNGKMVRLGVWTCCPILMFTGKHLVPETRVYERCW